MALPQLNIVKTGNCIIISNGNDAPVAIPVANVTRVLGQFGNKTSGVLWMNTQSGEARTPTSNIQTRVKIETITGAEIFDCDDVINQAGWQGKTVAALSQAISDIAGWL